MELKVIKAENALDGFDQLIEARKNGEFAVWSFGGFINTSEDVPANFETISYDEIINAMKVAAIERNEALEKKDGIQK